MKLRRLNPETNKTVRATLYVVGIGGFAHLSTLLIAAVTQHKPLYFQPLYTIDVDRIWPSLPNNPVVYIGGWAVFFGAIYALRRCLGRSPKP